MSYREELMTEPDRDRVKRIENALLEIKRHVNSLERDCSEADKVLCHAGSISLEIACVFPEWMVKERREWEVSICQKCGCTKPCGCDNYTRDDQDTCSRCGCTKPCGCDNYSQK